MLGIRKRDHVTNYSIYSMTNSEPLVYCVRKRQLRFLGHILRLPEEEPARSYALYFPPHGKRRPACGRPRTSYISYINQVLGYDKHEMSADQIATIAQDRSAWRNLVVACSAAEGWWWSPLIKGRFFTPSLVLSSVFSSLFYLQLNFRLFTPSTQLYFYRAPRSFNTQTLSMYHPTLVYPSSSFP